MTNQEATYLYRRDIAAAILAYDRARRDALVRFAGNSDAIQGAFCNLWGNCRVAFDRASFLLDCRRQGMVKVFSDRYGDHDAPIAMYGANHV